MASLATDFPLPDSISDAFGRSAEMESWFQDLITIGSVSARLIESVDSACVWHLAISTPAVDLTASAFLYGWLAQKILHNPNSKSPKRISTEALKPGQIVAGYRKATSTEFPLGREFSGRVTKVEADIKPPRFTILVNKNNSRTINTNYVTDLFELQYEGNVENYIGAWDEMNRNQEDISPWEVLLGVGKKSLSEFLEPTILVNMPIMNFQTEQDLLFEFKIGDAQLSYTFESILSRATPGKLHSNFMEVNSVKKDSNSNYENFEIHIMSGSRAILENIDFSSQKMKIYIVGRNENSSEAAIQTILDRRNTGFEIPILDGIQLKNESLEFLPFGTYK